MSKYVAIVLCLLVASATALVCEDLMAHFIEDAANAIVAPPSAVLTLSGSTVDGETFSGSDTVKVSEAQ